MCPSLAGISERFEGSLRRVQEACFGTFADAREITNDAICTFDCVNRAFALLAVCPQHGSAVITALEVQLTAISLQDRLRQSIHSSDLIGELATITKELRGQADRGFIEPILRFMEENPRLEFGLPGPLVHFVEKFHGGGYDVELLASLKRHPTPHTVWMLNRIINGTKSTPDRNLLVDALKAAGEHPRADGETKAQVSGFMSRLSGQMTAVAPK